MIVFLSLACRYDWRALNCGRPLMRIVRAKSRYRKFFLLVRITLNLGVAHGVFEAADLMAMSQEVADWRVATEICVYSSLG